MIKKNIVALLVTAILLMFTACSGNGSGGSSGGKVNIEKYNYNSEKKFRLIADTPQGSNTTLDKYLALGLTGYIMLESGYGLTSNDGKFVSTYDSGLKNVASKGLDIYIRNQYNDPDYFDNDDDKTQKPCYDGVYTLPVRHLTDEFRQYDNIVGFYMADEPTYEKMSSFGNLINWHNKNYPDKFFHMNLFPSYANSKSLGNVTYDLYVQKYIDEVISKVVSEKSLCLDNYPLIKGSNGNVIRSSYLTDLLITALKTKEYNQSKDILSKAEYGICIQSFYDGGLRDLECTADATFQLAMGMAMGANLFEYFMYGTGGGMYGLTANGEPRPIYNYVKEANEKMLWYDKIINCFDWQGIITSYANNEKDRENSESFDNVRDLLLSDTGRLRSIKSRLDCVVGVFEDKDGNDGYMLVNYTEPSKNKVNFVDLTFENSTHLLVYKDNSYSATELVKGKTQVRLNAGEGIFLVPINA